MGRRPKANIQVPFYGSGQGLISGSSARDAVPVRRSPIALARRLDQICTSVAAESVAGTDLSRYEFAALVYLNRAHGQPDLDQISLAARIGIDRTHTSLLVTQLEK